MLFSKKEDTYSSHEIIAYLVELALLWGNIRHVFHKWMCAGKIYTTYT